MNFNRTVRAGLAALLLTFFTALPTFAVVDRAVCSASDSGGTSCTAAQLKTNINEEVGAVDTRAPMALLSVSGTNTITASVTPTLTSYQNYQVYLLKPANDITGAATLNINSIGAKAVVNASGSALGSGDLIATNLYIAVYFSSGDHFRVITNLGSGGFASSSGTFIMQANSGSFSAERALTAGTGIGLTDGGANSTMTVAISDAEILALAGLTSAADKVPYFTGSGTAAVADFSSAVRTLITTPSSANLRSMLSDEVGTGGAMFGLISTMADDLGCTGSQIVRRNSGDTAFECAAAPGGGNALTSDPLSQFAATTSSQLRGVLSDETGTGAAMFGLTTAMADDLSCTGSQVVRRNAGDSAFECATPSTGRSLVTTGTASSSSSLDFSVSSACSRYEFELENLTPASNADIYIRVSVSGSYQSASGDYTSYSENNAAATPTTAMNPTVNGTVTVLSSGSGMSGSVNMFGAGGTSKKKPFNWQVVWDTGSANTLFTGIGGGWFKTNNSALDGVRFIASTGNLASGVVRQYCYVQ